MSKIEKCCVLAVDVSGSVVGFKFYWHYVSKLLHEILCKSYSSYRIVCWSSRFHEVTVEILREYINDLQDDQAGGTEPSLIWEFLDQNELTNFDLYLVTDGEIDVIHYDRYVDLYDALTLKPDTIHVHYCGRLMGMNMSFLDCFENVQYVINGLDTNSKVVKYSSTKVPKGVLFQQLCNLDEFKKIESNAVDDLTTVLQELYKILYRKMMEYSGTELSGPIGADFKKFVDLINKVVHRNYMDVHVKEEAAQFDDLFDDYKSNSKKIFDIFVKRFLNATTVDYRKILSQIIELGNGQLKVDRRLVAYGGEWYERVKSGMKPTDESEEDEEYGFAPKRMKMMDDEEEAPESNASCPILLLDSGEYNKFCVLWVGINQQFGGSQFEAALNMLRRKIVKSPLRLFEFLSPEILNSRVPPANQHVSIDAFLGLECTELTYMGYKRFNRVFKSPLHQAPCFGIVLYNADSNVKFPTKMTQNEVNILLHNYATIALLLFGDTEFVGSFPLLHTFFLQILMQCHRIDPYIKLCIKRTLERTSTILKCRFMLDSGLEPSFYSSIKNAIIFHTDIYPNEIDKLTESVPGIEALNIPRKRVQYCTGLLDLAQDRFDVKFSEEYLKKLKLWRFWNYMLCITHISNDKKLIHFKQIALSKLQNWQPVENGQIKMMLVEGKSEKPYLDYLNDVEFDDIVKLIILFESKKVKRLTDKICTKNHSSCHSFIVPYTNASNTIL